MIIIKREILQSLFDAIKSLSKLFRTATLDKENNVEEANFCQHVFSLFLKLRPVITDYQINKLKKIDKPIFKDMVKDIEEAMIDNHKIEFTTWKKYFMNMETMVRKLNIYGIGFVKDDPEQAWMSGMTE